MCTTRRYYFVCSHPATYRFRNHLCDCPSVRGCKVRDYNVYLCHPCQKCRNIGMPSIYTCGDEPKHTDVWHIPSRCFVDVGFRSINPFREEDDDSKPGSSTALSRRQSTDEGPLTPPAIPTKAVPAESNVCWRLLRRLTVRKPTPCCAIETLRGALEATRIEGRDCRVAGVIPARCESPV
jgi:hypothetical protein